MVENISEKKNYVDLRNIGFMLNRPKVDKKKLHETEYFKDLLSRSGHRANGPLYKKKHKRGIKRKHF